MQPTDNNDTYRFMRQRPLIGARVYIHPQTYISGAVTLGDDVSVWPMSVLRGDVNRIEVGPRSNLQDGSVLHVTHEHSVQTTGLALVVGADVTVGHRVILHACTVGDRCLVGMGAIVMDGAVLEPDSLIAGGAVVTPGTRVPSGTLWRGNPARQARRLTAAEIDQQVYIAAHYVRLKDLYLAEPA